MTSDNPNAALYAALALAQAELKNPAMNGTNPAFKRGNSTSRYATLIDVRNAVVPALSKHGICVVQSPKMVRDGTTMSAGVMTMLCHKDGGSIISELMLPCSKTDAHGVGSAITYARRFSLMAIAGVVGDEDDDGNAAADVQPAPQRAVAAAMSADEGKALLAEWTGIKVENDLRSAAAKCFSLAGVQLKPKTPPTASQWGELGAWINTQKANGVDFITLSGGK